MNKIIICGSKQFTKKIGEDFWHNVDIPSIKYYTDYPDLNANLVYRQISHASCVIVQLEEINAKTLLIMGIARGLGKLIVGVGSEDFFTDQSTNELVSIALDLCELQTLDEDTVGEVLDYI